MGLLSKIRGSGVLEKGQKIIEKTSKNPSKINPKTVNKSIKKRPWKNIEKMTPKYATWLQKLCYFGPICLIISRGGASFFRLNGARSTSGSVFPFFIENDAKIYQKWCDYGSIWVALTPILRDSVWILKIFGDFIGEFLNDLIKDVHEILASISG